MTLIKQSVISKVEVFENGSILVKTVNRVLEDGVVIASENHRKVIEKNDDILNEAGKVQAIASAAWSE